MLESILSLVAAVFFIVGFGTWIGAIIYTKNWFASTIVFGVVHIFNLINYSVESKAGNYIGSNWDLGPWFFVGYITSLSLWIFSSIMIIRHEKNKSFV